MHYGYMLRSQSKPTQTYIGFTDDLRTRLRAHNEGSSPHTAKFRPWTLECYVAFANRQQALDFERYLKSGSGHAFAKRRLWSGLWSGLAVASHLG